MWGYDTYLTDAEVDHFDAVLHAEISGDTRAWILSDRDVWYRNPYYTGPPQRHPEDYDYPEEEEE